MVIVAGVISENAHESKNPGAKNVRAGVPKKHARWLAEGQLNKISTQQP
jgi:hypothetical protein